MKEIKKLIFYKRNLDKLMNVIEESDGYNEYRKLTNDSVEDENLSISEERNIVLKNNKKVNVGITSYITGNNGVHYKTTYRGTMHYNNVEEFVLDSIIKRKITSDGINTNTQIDIREYSEPVKKLEKRLK